jgi:hypothetical protein
MKAKRPARISGTDGLRAGLRQPSERNMNTATKVYKYMKSRVTWQTRVLISAIAALVSWTRANGQAPSGLLEYALGPRQGLALWNFSGAYSVPYYNNLQLHEDAKGKLTAAIETQGWTNVALLGTVTGSGSRLRMQLRSTATFPDYLPQLNLASMRKDNLSLKFDADAGTLTGIDHISQTTAQYQMVCPNSFWECDHWELVHRTYSTNEAVVIAVPEATDGNWKLELNIVPLGNKLSGAASVTFSSGERFDFQLFGHYAPKTQKTMLLLKGYGDDTGALLALSLAGPGMNIKWIHGIVGGEQVHFP